ncbi:glycerophosphodiester phosphodiesterase [Actinomadura mexicana]|uniref:Glycerophosphoryl diester phosphodiesterase n=1 Tax=Actinomadura mexicana TaxID=134959 RepID=A0A239HNR6_9ACTN|nr:glycerophosphodiester phosphodiesterase family protein [Actinomadura mexicana]SNS83006.1 glycerophosphoryl diester phosphodiesterase [Actinomadura mexicana]
MHRRNRLALIAVLATAAVAAPAAPADARPGPDPILSLLPGAPEPRPRTAPARAPDPDAGVLNVAHRGASAYAPENTLAAFRLARAKKADMFELDVQETKDHQLVIMHDTTLVRTTNAEEVFPGRRPWRVADFTLAEVGRLDAGGWFAKRYAGERVPTLGQVLAGMRGRGLGLLLEIKSPELYPGIERRVAAELERSPSWLRYDPRERRLVVQSFDWESVRRFHAVLPRVPTGLLGTPRVADLPKLAKYADQVNPTFSGLTESYVEELHDAGMDVLTWTIDDPGDMERAIDLDVDGVITDRPDVLHGVLGDSAERAA